ncbi:hypothetical protein QP662_12610, partial [Staphylococcus epidermidis]|nr:hypothetical protein [Staphylococcus epidermidis]
TRFYNIFLAPIQFHQNDKVSFLELTPKSSNKCHLFGVHSKLLLTLDTINPTANYDGIQKINLIDWLLQ